MAPPVESPFVGLIPFSEEHARFFFGREKDRKAILANLYSGRVSVLFGPSGAGKSSVLKAGVCRELRDKIEGAKARGVRPDFAFVYLHEWQEDPLAGIRRALTEALADTLGTSVDLPDDLRLVDLLERSAHILEGDLFLIFDQFDEYLQAHPELDVLRPFEQQLVESLTRRYLPASFLIALRDDAATQLQRFKRQVPHLLTSSHSLRRLTTEQAKEAITGPVAVYNALRADERAIKQDITIEPDLVSAVVDEVRSGRIGDEDALGRVPTESTEIDPPYLQLVMKRLWEYETGSGSSALRRDTLRALNGAATIVKTYFDEIMSELSADDQEISSAMFAHLVTPSGFKVPHSVDDLASYAGAPSKRISAIVEALRKNRILATTQGPSSGTAVPRYAIQHDALGPAILAWRRRYLEQKSLRQIDMAQSQEVARANQLAGAEQKRAMLQAQRARRRLTIAAVLTVGLTVGLLGMTLATYRAAVQGELAATEAVAAREQYQESLDAARRAQASSETAVREAEQARQEYGRLLEQIKLSPQQRSLLDRLQRDRESALQSLATARSQIDELRIDRDAALQSLATARLQVDELRDKARRSTRYSLVVVQPRARQPRKEP